MKIKTVFLLTFLLFNSFFNIGNAVLTEEPRINIESEYQLSEDQCSDDVEMYSEIKTVIDVSSPSSLHAMEAKAISTFTFDLLEPPKPSSFNS